MMNGQEQAVVRMELQIGQLIRMVANLNERVEALERLERSKTIRVLHMKRLSRV